MTEVLVSTVKLTSSTGSVTVWNLDQNGNPINPPSTFNITHNQDVHPGYDFIFIIKDNRCNIHRATTGSLPNGDEGWIIDDNFSPSPVCFGPQAKVQIS